VIAVGARAAFFERFIAVGLEHQLCGAANVDLGYHVAKCATAVDKG
jgi:hypothetical protein